MCEQSLAENALEKGGFSKFVLLDTLRGNEVADAARFCEEARKMKRGRQDAVMQMEK